MRHGTLISAEIGVYFRGFVWLLKTGVYKYYENILKFNSANKLVFLQTTQRALLTMKTNSTRTQKSRKYLAAR